MLCLIISSIEDFKNRNLKKNLYFFDPNKKKTPNPFQSTININITYVTKHMKRIMPYEGAIEISACSFVTKHKNRNPFLVHDILHSVAKYLSSQTKLTFKISYQKDSLIKRMGLSGSRIKLEKEKDEILALCLHWFIWKYSPDPYKLDQSFKKIPMSTNLLYGKMYGYHDVKEYDSEIDCWERHTPTYEYSKGRTKGIEFNIEKSKTKNVYIHPKSLLENSVQNKKNEICRRINESLILENKLTQNPFYHVVPEMLEKLCFSNDRKMERNLIPPSDARDEWGNNFDAWFFVFSVFMTHCSLKNKYSEHILNQHKKDFLSDYDQIKIIMSDINFDHHVYDAFSCHDHFLNEESIGLGNLYEKLESYMEYKYKEISSEVKESSISEHKKAFFTFLAFWNYLLFGSYIHISQWNRLITTKAVKEIIDKIEGFLMEFDLFTKNDNNQFDPTLN
jgi:hypothetical protein